MTKHAMKPAARPRRKAVWEQWAVITDGAFAQIRYMDGDKTKALTFAKLCQPGSRIALVEIREKPPRKRKGK